MVVSHILYVRRTDCAKRKMHCEEYSTHFYHLTLHSLVFASLALFMTCMYSAHHFGPKDLSSKMGQK